MNSYRVLVIDDSNDISMLVQQLLESQGYTADTAANGDDARRLLGTREYDAILLDYKLGNEDGSQLMSEILGKDPAQSVIMVTAFGSIEKAVDTLKAGAFSFIAKPFDNGLLMQQVKQACERSGLKKENSRLKSMLSNPATSMISTIIGTSAPMMRLFDQVRQVAQVDSTVLITGDSGTGKELVSRALHDLSPRAKNRFGAINCGAIPAALLESELFGHKRGAFTDARTDRKGLFESCTTGTLFLDEIGEMPIELQVKLLRVLQEKEIVPLGGDRPIAVDVRIVTATNRNLREEVRKGKFREDLFFRINVIPLHIPSLKERRDDIPLLAQHFMNVYSQQFNRKMDPISEELMRQLTAYDWPGNVRELQNNIERAVVMSTDGKLHPEHLFMDTVLKDPLLNPVGGAILPYSEAKEEFEKSYLNHLLEASDGNIAEAARLAGRYRADIYRLLSKYHLKQPKR
jgi:two-component system response regulator GlrR